MGRGGLTEVRRSHPKGLLGAGGKLVVDCGIGQSGGNTQRPRREGESSQRGEVNHGEVKKPHFGVLCAVSPLYCVKLRQYLHSVLQSGARARARAHAHARAISISGGRGFWRVKHQKQQRGSVEDQGGVVSDFAL